MAAPCSPTSANELALHSPSSDACFPGLTHKNERGDSHASALGANKKCSMLEHNDKASPVTVEESPVRPQGQSAVLSEENHVDCEGPHPSTRVDMFVQNSDEPPHIVRVEPSATIGSIDRSSKATHSSIVSNSHVHVADICRGAMEGPSTGVMSICGMRPEMEDAVTIAHNFLLLSCRHTGECSGECFAYDANERGAIAPLHFFGVYDGHGGSQVSSFCKEKLHIALANELQIAYEDVQINTSCMRATWESCWEKAMFSTFHKVDAGIEGYAWRGALENDESVRERISEPRAPETVGSTAIVAVLGSHQIVIANCGDSRAVLSRGGQAVALSIDHKPNREDELARIEAAGGRVICWNGYRVFGVLAMSRSIDEVRHTWLDAVVEPEGCRVPLQHLARQDGQPMLTCGQACLFIPGDRYLKPYVIPEPEVKCISRTKDDECLILASDGLWDVLSNEKVCEVARKCLTRRVAANQEGLRSPGFTKGSNDKNAEAAAALLTKMALAEGSHDNISVVVVDLKDRKRS